MRDKPGEFSKKNKEPGSTLTRMGIALRTIHALSQCCLYPRYRAFMRDKEAYGRVQQEKLIHYLRKNENTVFGREHRFADISTVERYRSQVPVRDYEGFKPYIERVAEGRKKVLTSEEVRFLEPTGGTSSGPKLIPYTASLKQEFQRALYPWLFDLYRNVGGLSSGRAYWSITPVAAGRGRTAGGVTIGFEDDYDYAGFAGSLLRRLECVPRQVQEIKNLENFRYATALFLLACADLTLISVWNPSFFLLILDSIERHREALVRDVRDGCLRLPDDGAEGPGSSLSAPRPSHQRARFLERVLAGPVEQRYRRIWDRLEVISCWAEGGASYHAQKLGELFPGVRIQPKGLLATEGVVSIPLVDARGSLPAYRSHFLEFISEDDHRPRLLDELENGSVYTVVLTTGGGLYRYDLKDKVRVVGRFAGLPVIEFCGRGGVSDVVGEKLDEGHVLRVIDSVVSAAGIKVEFVLFAPEVDRRGAYYTLFIEPQAGLELAPERQEQLIEAVDQGLKENFYYRYARDIGQLRPPRLFCVEPGAGREAFLARCAADGQRLGDIKQTVLDRRTGWTAVFCSVLRGRPPGFQSGPGPRGITRGGNE